MLKSTTLALTIALSVTLAAGQTPDTASSAAPEPAKLRDLQFGNGVDLQFLLKELGRQMDLNVLFDPESFRTSRKTNIELRNTTPAEAFAAILRQEHLLTEPIDTKTILLALEAQAHKSLPIGVGVMPISDQLRQYFGVQNGVLVHTVRPDTAAAKAGIRAGDVITEIDNTPVQGVLNLSRAMLDKPEAEITLKMTRDRKPLTITLPTPKGIGQ